MRSAYSKFRHRRLRRRGRQRPPSVVTPKEGGLSREASPGVVVQTCEEPVVTVVIPVYGQSATTLRCLASIATARVETPFEIVVVDDASIDDTVEVLEACVGVRVLRNDQNQGYIRATNRGAAAAQGQYLVLLNNDTEVTDGWIDRLLDVYRTFPDTGLVGARLVYPDGRLQEAGSIIWSDGSGWNYGRFDDPNDPQFSFVREVDYCSAACLAVPVELWQDIGGFDERYVPAYYEDVDLAFEARARGRRVRYQPDALVVHYEGITHGTDETSGLKAHQVENRARFVAKWEEELESQRPNDPDLVLHASTRVHSGRVLVADYEVPHWDQHAGGQRMQHMLEFLVELDWQVTFVPGNLAATQPYASRVRQLGIEVLEAPLNLGTFVEQRAATFDLALLSRPDDGIRWFSLLRNSCPDLPIVYDTVDLHGVRMARAREFGVDHFDSATEKRVAEQERLLIRESDLTVVCSDADARWIADMIPGTPTAVLGTIHEGVDNGVAFDDRTGLLFVGSWNHPPNVDAVGYFLDEIFPLVRDELPEVKVHLVGSNQPARLARGVAGVVCHGWVENLDLLYDTIRVSVAPLRFGSGIKGKIGEALMHGVPVVTTSAGAEGFEFDDSFRIDVGDSAQAFADAVVALYTDRVRWESVAESGRRAMEGLLGTGRARERLIGILDCAGKVRADASA